MMRAHAHTTAGGSCDYCGLPLARSTWSLAKSRAAGEINRQSEPQFCCYGCRLAAQITGERGERGIAQTTLLRIGLSVFLSLNVMMFTMALWSQDFYGSTAGNDASQLASSLADLLRYLCLLLSLPVLGLLGLPLWEHAWSRGWRGLASTDALILLGVAAAFVYSTISVFRGAGHVYFEVGCTVLVMVTLGRWLEATGKLQATEGLEALERLLPNEVRRLTAAGECHTPLGEIGIGDQIRVLAGERIPVDGIVARGSAMLDRQLLTGESEPVCCEPGTSVAAGGLNLDGELLIDVTAPASQGALSRLVQLVRDARQTKGRYQRMAERVASLFLPVVLAIAVATFGWHTWQHGFEQGVLASLAVLLIACPCALGLATPMAVSAALGTAAREHVLIQHGEAIERLARVRAIRFDKTGTLTTGTPRVDRTILASGTPAVEVIRRGGALAAGSNHVYAQAIARWSDEAYPAGAANTLAELRTYPGRGVSGSFENASSVTYLGSAAWMNELGLTISPKLAQAVARAQTTGEALSLLGWDGEVRALFVLGEQLRPTAALALADCARLGLDVEILTGDHPQRGELLSEILDFPVVAGQLPEDKVAAIHQARQRFGSVAMVGDGVNDAPALAAADLGIALGCGADVSRDSAQICLLGNDPARVAWTVALARRTVRIIRWNLVWAFGYNAIGVGLAAAGWLNPAWAALAMVVSSALVIGNCLRLQAGGRDATTQPPFARNLAQLPEADVSLSAQLETPLVAVR